VLREHYNLEDKVLFVERGDDTDVEDEAMLQRRSARTKQLPKHWDIYQLGYKSLGNGVQVVGRTFAGKVVTCCSYC